LKGIIFAQNKEKGEVFLKPINGKKPLFTFVIGVTETAKIPGISAQVKIRS